MRYQVAHVKLKDLSYNVSKIQSPDCTIKIRGPDRLVQQTQKMIIVEESPESGFVERKNAINKMVNTETSENIRKNEQKETFQYQVPRVRASFTLKVAPDSTTADLPESTNKLVNSSDEAEALAGNKYDTNIPPTKTNIPQYGPHLPGCDPFPTEFDRQLSDLTPRITAPVINNVPRFPKPILANRSGNHIQSDDKDFEIPLEESLKAVEDFIKREKELARWHIGEDVLAKWKGNGLFYKAKILDILSSGVVIILYDSYDITEEIDYRDLCKFFKKTSNFKKKGRPQEKPQADIDKIKISAEKSMKLKKRRKKICRKLHFISIFKQSDRLRKKRLYACHKKSHSLSVVRSKNQVSPTVTKSRMMS